MNLAIDALATLFGSKSNFIRTSTIADVRSRLDGRPWAASPRLIEGFPWIRMLLQESVQLLRKLLEMCHKAVSEEDGESKRLHVGIDELILPDDWWRTDECSTRRG